MRQFSPTNWCSERHCYYHQQPVVSSPTNPPPHHQWKSLTRWGHTQRPRGYIMTGHEGVLRGGKSYLNFLIIKHFSPGTGQQDSVAFWGHTYTLKREVSVVGTEIDSKASILPPRQQPCWPTVAGVCVCACARAVAKKFCVNVALPPAYVCLLKAFICPGVSVCCLSLASCFFSFCFG